MSSAGRRSELAHNQAPGGQSARVGAGDCSRTRRCSGRRSRTGLWRVQLVSKIMGGYIRNVCRARPRPQTLDAFKPCFRASEADVSNASSHQLHQEVLRKINTETLIVLIFPAFFGSSIITCMCMCHPKTLGSSRVGSEQVARGALSQNAGHALSTMHHIHACMQSRQ